MYDDYFGGQPSATVENVSTVQEPQVRQRSTVSTTIADNVPIPTNSSSHATNIPITLQDVNPFVNTFVNPFANSSTSAAIASSSSQNVDPSNMHTFYQPYPHEFQWTKDHPLEQVIGEPSRPVLTRNQLRSDGDMCIYALTLMNDLKRNKHFPEKTASNLMFLNNLQPEWSRHVTIVHQTKDLHTDDYTQLYDFLKYNQKEVDELKAERLVKTQDPLALMANSNNPYVFPAPHQDQPSFNQNYLQQPIPNPEDITNPTTAMNMALALMAKAFKLNYLTPTNNNQRISSNPRNRQIAQSGMNMGQDRQMQMVRGNGGNQFRQYAGQNAGNTTGYNDVIGNPVIQDAIQNLRVQNAGNQNGLIGEEYDLMAAAVDLDEINEVNANCILMANLQQASTSGTQTDRAPVYDTDGSELTLQE
nr:hypothetical protein [Tanacetum cinerariifolium]